MEDPGLAPGAALCGGGLQAGSGVDGGPGPAGVPVVDRVQGRDANPRHGHMGPPVVDRGAVRGVNTGHGPVGPSAAPRGPGYFFRGHGTPHDPGSPPVGPRHLGHQAPVNQFSRPGHHGSVIPAATNPLTSPRHPLGTQPNPLYGHGPGSRYHAASRGPTRRGWAHVPLDWRGVYPFTPL